MKMTTVSSFLDTAIIINVRINAIVYTVLLYILILESQILKALCEGNNDVRFVWYKNL